MGDRLEELSRRGYEAYPISPYLSCALSKDRILILTPISTYLVSKSQLNAAAGHARIRRGIVNREYKCVADILTDMRLSPGVGVAYRMARLEEIL